MSIEFELFDQAKRRARRRGFFGGVILVLVVLAVLLLANTISDLKRNDPHIRVECTVWSSEVKEKTGFSDSLNVVAMTTEILDWIYSGYK